MTVRLPDIFARAELANVDEEYRYDADPPEFEGEFLEQYRQERDRFDAAFSGFPEHQKSVMWVLARRLAEAHVAALLPEVRADPALRVMQDRALVQLTRELGQITRSVDHLEVQKTQLVITILAVIGDAVNDIIDESETRNLLMSEIRRRCLHLFGQ